MDCFSVAVSYGLIRKKVNIIQKLKIALSFGFFQGFMPFIGYLGGNVLKNFILNIDHWIAFVLLGYIGMKIIIGAIKKNENIKNDLSQFKILLLLSFATSIDALVIGIGFSFISINIIFACLIIGLITFIVSYIGVNSGNLFKNYTQGKLIKYVEILAGCILIFIGLKIFITHIFGL